MIQSYAYDIIKEEGIQEGVQIGVQQEKLHSKRKAVCTALETRFTLVPSNVLEMIHSIETVPALEELHRQAITVEDIPTFAKIIRTVLTPV